ncbi:MAG: bifunctional phosphoribosyl-AMP cyclohydrolase/phosphoribosyl-ATP diphosphatase HisIE [Flavobacteriaceae bacterium]
MKLDFEKNQDGLLPAIIQDVSTKNVLMLGYMNREALAKTLETKKVTFYSRSKGRIWTKGEESGHFLNLVDIKPDCDQDTLLIMALPDGPTCHKGSDTCWGGANGQEYGFLTTLEKTIADRKLRAENGPGKGEQSSYVTSLFEEGLNKIAQKVGEEAIEVIIEAKDNNDDLFLNESADLLFHYLILLQAKGFGLDDVAMLLKSREKK